MNVFFQDIVSGSFSGITAMIVTQPMSFLKLMSQTGKVIPKNPLCWYRGSGGISLSYPITIATQSAAFGTFSTMMGSVYAATAAGAVSAFIVCPSERIMIEQQKTGLDLKNSIKNIHANYKMRGFFRGLVPTIGRESIFTWVYSEGVPLLKKKCVKMGMAEWPANLLAGVSVGVFGAAISHPTDTVKSKWQFHPEKRVSLIKDHFQKGAFAGFGWRATLFVTAVTFMPIAKQFADSQFKRVSL